MPGDDAYVDAVLRAQHASDRMWRELVPEARRRLQFDPILAAQVSTAVRLVEAETARSLGVHYEELDPVRHGVRHGAWLGAAVALVIAERPELITGQPTDRQPPVKVLAGVLAPTLLGLTGPPPRIVGEGWQDAEVFARRLLEALEAAGWEVFWRADRFATIADGGRRVRIPTRGVCRTCLLDVERAVEVNDGEVLVDHWRHLDTRGPHRDDAITDVNPR